MAKYIAVRLAGLLPTAILITLISFAIIQITPGDPAVLLLQQRGIDPTNEAVAEMRGELGLDKPFWQRYLLWLWRVCHGDLGYSFYTREAVATEIMQRIPATLELTLAAMMFSLTAAFIVGIFAAKYEDKLPDKVSKAYALLAVSLPSYWLGLILIYIFAVKLQWLPAVGRGGSVNLVLPAISLGFTSAAIHAQLLRSGLSEAVNQDYAGFARAKGLTS
ncbi:MAG: ABC transporter permease, partial [Negativicutes bacterium]|nr:ABC transporter permease [Negativicutes bacterium]